MSYTVKTFRYRIDVEKARDIMADLGWSNVTIVTCQENPSNRTYYAIRSGTQWLMDNGEMH